jgi:hypothetical protein
MSHPLDGCWAKIKRANENIDNLRTEIINFTGSNDYRVVRDVNKETRKYTFRAFGPDNAIPLRFSVLAGEIIHHLRSSLDHLTWALVLVTKRPLLKFNSPSAPQCQRRSEFALEPAV